MRSIKEWVIERTNAGVHEVKTEYDNRASCVRANRPACRRRQLKKNNLLTAWGHNRISWSESMWSDSCWSLLQVRTRESLKDQYQYADIAKSNPNTESEIYYHRHVNGGEM